MNILYINFGNLSGGIKLGLAVTLGFRKICSRTP